MCEVENMLQITQTDIVDNVTIHCKDIASEHVFKEDIFELMIMCILLFLVFLISVSVNITILVAFYRKQSLRTISNRCTMLYLIFTRVNSYLHFQFVNYAYNHAYTIPDSLHFQPFLMYQGHIRYKLGNLLVT